MHACTQRYTTIAAQYVPWGFPRLNGVDVSWIFLKRCVFMPDVDRNTWILRVRPGAFGWKYVTVPKVIRYRRIVVMCLSLHVTLHISIVPKKCKFACPLFLKLQHTHTCAVPDS